MSFTHLHHLIRESRSEQSDYSESVTAITFFTPIVLIIFLALYRKYVHSLKVVKNGVFRQDLPLTRDNLFEAYLCLAAIMIQKEKLDAGKKLLFIKKYFLNYFPENYYNFTDVIIDYYKSEPVKISSVAIWINKYVKEYEKRSQVLYFLASIAMVDGEIVSTELAFMKEIARLLNLNDDELDRILNTHFYSENKKKIDNKSISSSTLLISAFKVLGLEKGVSIEQVKSSYRKLAMIHHPDKFSTESEAQQKIAHERFVKINDAYEYVLKSF